MHLMKIQRKLRMKQMHKYIHPLQQQHVAQRAKVSRHPVEQDSFKDVLSAVQEVKISKHAKQRMVERNISLDDSVLDKLTNKMNEAKQKGVTDAVVVMDDISFVVSTKNNTIITALNQEEASNQIFTNINGTIIL